MTHRGRAVTDIIWKGSSLKEVTEFPREAKRELGFELHNIQLGRDPSDWKPMPTIGKCVREIRLHLKNEYRIIYVAKFKEAVYVLHAFVKKTQKTQSKDINLAKMRYLTIQKRRETNAI